ncbi:amidase [Agrobacterium vitis]|nr:amidase family protein [Agrobacterium vitis]
MGLGTDTSGSIRLPASQ